MNNQVKAIYENGIFRPLERVVLEEQQEAMLSVYLNKEENLADIAT